ncbi:M56 family metallopeptidase [Maribacter sp. 4G9]|uniref:M56 family metallopeptidase n=1 Tax=Maribacter sp. 4G9 TaxID=1889777 RepID=UPI0013FDF984|nr:M56 family metallopeptidase [Maribacter sp. 4G9]
MTPALPMDEISSFANSWPFFIVLIYLFGASLLLFRLIREFYQLLILLKNGRNESQGKYSYVESNTIISPFSFFNWIVYNPKLHSKRELDIILEHEKIHSRQLHSLDILLMELFLILQWFNPFTWLYRKSLKENLEFLADAHVYESQKDKKEYQYLLLKQAVGQQNLSIINPFFNSLIKKRIVMINQNPSHKLKAIKSLIILPFLAIFLLSFNVRTKYTFKDTQQNASQDNIIELIIDKATTDKELVKIKNDLKKDNIDFSYTTVRNEDGEISSLSIHVSGNNKNGTEFSSSHNSHSDNNTIDPTYILIDMDNNSISIGNGKNNVLHKSDHARVWIQKSYGEEAQKEIIIKNINGQKQVTINGEEVSDEDLEDMDIDVDDNSFIYIDSDDDKNATKESIVIRKVSPDSKKHVIIKSNSDEEHDVEIIEKESNGFFFLDTDSDKEPLIIIDGKVSTEKQLTKLDPSNIKSMNVIKGSKAIKKHGKKATDGVIEITTN